MKQNKLRGKERRAKKSEVSSLKHFIKMFWYFEDIDRVNGIGMDDKTCEDILETARKDIAKIEVELMEKETVII